MTTTIDNFTKNLYDNLEAIEETEKASLEAIAARLVQVGVNKPPILNS